jgi:Tol biopolymer transport system component
MCRAWALAILAAGGCDRVFNLEHVEDGGAASADMSDDPDAAGDENIQEMFGASSQLYELSSVETEDDPTVTDDLLDIYFNSYRSGSGDIWHASRASASAAWGQLVNVSALNTSDVDNTPRISGDGRVMYMSRETYGVRDIYVTTRPSRTADDWLALKAVTELNSVADDSEAVLTADGLSIYFSSTRGGNKDIYVATRTAIDVDWSEAQPVAGINTSSDEDSPHTHDGLTLYFSSTRPGSHALTNIWRATRTDVDAAFSAPVPVDELNTDEREEDPWVSPDGRTIWFASSRGGGVFHLFTATR